MTPRTKKIKNDIFRDERRASMSSSFHPINGKAKPWRFCKCCYSSEEKEVDEIVKDVMPSANGVGHNEEFAPVEHPLEPPDIDKPARCPPQEPCIVHDGRIWKERVAIAKRRLDMAKDSTSGYGRRSLSNDGLILPSRSAPATVILSYLDT